MLFFDTVVTLLPTESDLPEDAPPAESESGTALHISAHFDICDQPSFCRLLTN
jgi:hypothetical protein